MIKEVKIPYTVLEDPCLNLVDKVLFGFISCNLNEKGEFDLHNAVITKILGITSPTLAKAVKKLCTNNYINSAMRRNPVHNGIECRVITLMNNHL